MRIRSKKTPVKYQPALREGRRKLVEREPWCPRRSGDFWQFPWVKEMQGLTSTPEKLHLHLAKSLAASAELLYFAKPARSCGFPHHQFLKLVCSSDFPKCETSPSEPLPSASGNWSSWQDSTLSWAREVLCTDFGGCWVTLIINFQKYNAEEGRAWGLCQSTTRFSFKHSCRLNTNTFTNAWHPLVFFWRSLRKHDLTATTWCWGHFAESFLFQISIFKSWLFFFYQGLLCFSSLSASSF